MVLPWAVRDSWQSDAACRQFQADALPVQDRHAVGHRTSSIRLMDPLPLRLHPGDDLRGALEAALRAAGWEAVFVIAGIGSLVDARLRLAGAADPMLWPGDSEILSLSGSLSPDGAHLHAALSLADGRVVGGHVLPGNRVRTTAEVLVLPLPGWRFRRVVDPATGWAELHIQRWPASRG